MENSLSVNIDRPRESDVDNTTIIMQPMTIGTMDDPTVKKVAEITLNITLTKKSEPKTGEESGDEPVTYWTGAASAAAAPRANESTQPKQSSENQDALAHETSSDHSRPKDGELHKDDKTNYPVEVPKNASGEELLKPESVILDAETLKPAWPVDDKTSENPIQSMKDENKTSTVPEATDKLSPNTSEQLKSDTEDAINKNSPVSHEVVVLNDQNGNADNQNVEHKNVNGTVSNVEPDEILDDLNQKQDEPTSDGNKSECNERIGSITVSMDQSPTLIIVNGPAQQPSIDIEPVSSEHQNTVPTTTGVISVFSGHQDDIVIVSNNIGNTEKHITEDETKTQNENIIDSLTAISNDQPATIAPATNANSEYNSALVNNEQTTGELINKAEDTVSSPLKVVEETHQNEDISSLTAIANNEPALSSIVSKQENSDYPPDPAKILDDLNQKQDEPTFDGNKPESGERKGSITVSMDQSPTIITVNGPTDMDSQLSNNIESSDRQETVQNTTSQGHQDDQNKNAAVLDNVGNIEENKTQEETKTRNENIEIESGPPTTIVAVVAEDSHNINVQNFECPSNSNNDRPIGDLSNKVEDSISPALKEETTPQNDDIIASLTAIANNESPALSTDNVPITHSTGTLTMDTKSDVIAQLHQTTESSDSTVEPVSRPKSTEPLDAKNLQADTLLIVSSEDKKIVAEEEDDKNSADKLSEVLPTSEIVKSINENGADVPKSEVDTSTQIAKQNIADSDHIPLAVTQLGAQIESPESKSNGTIEADTLIIVSSSYNDTNKVVDKSNELASTAPKQENNLSPKENENNVNLSSEVPSSAKDHEVQFAPNFNYELEAEISGKDKTNDVTAPEHEANKLETNTTAGLIDLPSALSTDNKTAPEISLLVGQETSVPIVQLPPTADAGTNAELTEKQDSENKSNVSEKPEISLRNNISSADKTLDDLKPTDINVTYFNEEVNGKHPVDQSALSPEKDILSNAAADTTPLRDDHKHQSNIDHTSSNTVLDELAANEIKTETIASKSADSEANLLIADESNISIPTDKEAVGTAATEAALIGVDVPTNSVNNANKIDTVTNEIPSIVLPTDVVEQPIIYPDSKDWAMSDYTESSRAEDEDYDIYDDADDDGSTVATSGMSDVYGAGHRQSLGRGLRLPAAAVADGTIDPTAATLVAAVRAVTRVADERGEGDTAAQSTDVPMTISDKPVIDVIEQIDYRSLNADGMAPGESGEKPTDVIQDGELFEKPVQTVQQDAGTLKSIKSQEPTEHDTVKDGTNSNDKIEWIVVPQTRAQENGQSQNLSGTEAIKPQEPSKPAFNNKQLDNDAEKEITGVQKFEKLAEGWSGSGIASQNSSTPGQDRKDIGQHLEESNVSNNGSSNDKWQIKLTSGEDKSLLNHNETVNKPDAELPKEQATPPTPPTDSANNSNLDSKVRFAPDVKDNAKDDYEDYAQAINEYERSLKKHTRETLELVDKLCDQSQRLTQQKKPLEFEKAAQNPFDALPKIDSAATSNRITWNDGIFGKEGDGSFSMDIESLRIHPGLMVAPVNCLLLPSKRLVIIDNELGILLIDLETKNVLKSSDAPPSTTTRWRYPQCVAFVPEKEQLLVLAECCSTAKDNDNKITPDRIPTLAEVMAPKPTDFSLYICRFDAKTLRLLDRVEAPKYIRDKNVTGCHMCFAPPTGSIYLAVNTPHDAFVYELTEECRWIEVYNRRGRNFADLQYFAVVGPVTELLVLETHKQHVVMLSLYGSTVVRQRMVAVTERPGALAVDERAAVFAFDRASACVAQHSSMHFEKLRDIALVDRAQCRLSAQDHLLAVLVCPFKQIKLYKY